MKFLLGLLLLAAPVAAAPVVPNFTTGTVTSHTETLTTITEKVRQTDYHAGSSYTVTGTNINIPSKPGVGANYTIFDQGAPFQFTETSFGPGISRYTEIDRTMTIMSTTDSVSVFSQ